MGAQGEPAQSRIQVVASRCKRQLDRVISLATRENAYEATGNFAWDRPILFVFLALQLLFSLLPLVLFVSFAVSTTLFALVTALVFSLFWVGVALVLLACTLCVTGSVAVLVWLWLLSTFFFARWVYNLMPASTASAMRAGPPSPAGYKKIPGPSPTSTDRESTVPYPVYVDGDMYDKDAVERTENKNSE